MLIYMSLMQFVFICIMRLIQRRIKTDKSKMFLICIHFALILVFIYVRFGFIIRLIYIKAKYIWFLFMRRMEAIALILYV